MYILEIFFRIVDYSLHSFPPPEFADLDFPLQGELVVGVLPRSTGVLRARRHLEQKEWVEHQFCKKGYSIE